MTALAPPANPESVFTYGAPQLKFGPGAADEIGYDLSHTGARRVLVVTDPGVAATGSPQRIADQMAGFGIEARVFDGTHVEPTDESLEQAITCARESGPRDAFVAVGGGSSIDTAKAINLLMTNLLAPDADQPDDPAAFLPSVIAGLMRDIGIPGGIGAVGYDEGDIPDVAEVYRRSIGLW
jgi:alcohol dehydrogenase class IV